MAEDVISVVRKFELNKTKWSLSTSAKFMLLEVELVLINLVPKFRDVKGKRFDKYKPVIWLVST